MESTMTAMAGMGILLFLVFAGLAAMLAVSACLVSLVGGTAYLLQELAGWLRRSRASEPQLVTVS